MRSLPSLSGMWSYATGNPTVVGVVVVVVAIAAIAFVVRRVWKRK